MVVVAAVVMLLIAIDVFYNAFSNDEVTIDGSLAIKCGAFLFFVWLLLSVIGDWQKS